MLRAITDDGAFRVVAAMTTHTVREAVAAQSARGVTARCFGELITGTILVRETMAPGLRVQGIAKGKGGVGTLVADSYPDGSARGLAQVAKLEDRDAFAFGAGSLLQIMRTLPNGSIHQGIVDASGSGGISIALAEYMKDSEQVDCVAAVGTVLDASGVARAGGYVVQLLPEADRGVILIMAERLRALPTLDALLEGGLATPRAMLDELLYGMPFTEVESSPLRFECTCSLVRVVASLATLDHSAIEDLVRPEQVLEIGCDFCGKSYAVTPAQLRGLLRTS